LEAVTPTGADPHGDIPVGPGARAVGAVASQVAPPVEVAALLRAEDDAVVVRPQRRVDLHPGIDHRADAIVGPCARAVRAVAGQVLVPLQAAVVGHAVDD